MLIIKEGTLYPLLRNLEKWESKGSSLSLIQSYKRVEQDRRRTRRRCRTTADRRLCSRTLSVRGRPRIGKNAAWDQSDIFGKTQNL